MTWVAQPQHHQKVPPQLAIINRQDGQRMETYLKSARSEIASVLRYQAAKHSYERGGNERGRREGDAGEEMKGENKEGGFLSSVPFSLSRRRRSTIGEEKEEMGRKGKERKERRKRYQIPRKAYAKDKKGKSGKERKGSKQRNCLSLPFPSFLFISSSSFPFLSFPDRMERRWDQ